MTNIEAYTIWAPDGVLWTQWAKPVLFANMTYSGPVPLTIPKIRWLEYLNRDTAIIIDLPEKTGVAESLALAQIGYRPVPLYNGVCVENSTNMVVNVRNLSQALFAGAEMLAGMSIRGDAPPVFMLDSRRMEGYPKNPGKYDNRWCVFPQDMPSASFLLNHKITKIIVRTGLERKIYDNKQIQYDIQDDLSHILFRYQEAGIKIQAAFGGNEINDITVPKPSQFKSLFYRFRTLLGLSRNAVGGFGAMIPFLSDSDGYRGYGIG